MTLSPARKAAFSAILAIERGAWSAETLAAKTSHLSPRDSALASEIVYGVLRRRGQLDELIRFFSARSLAELDAEVCISLEIALYQLAFLDRIPAHAAVNDSVELVRRAGNESAARFVNGLLRNYLRKPHSVPDTFSTPKWLLDRWIANYGVETANGIVAASLKTPGRYIRVGTSSTIPEGAEPTAISGCYLLPSGDPGGCRFQDISSQAVVPLLRFEVGQSFLDLCAAPGNKTAQALETPLHAVAGELHLSRAKSLLPLGIPVAVLDAREFLPFNRKFDRILVDAPCSGTGTLARNPEIKWKLDPSDFADLKERQVSILRNAVRALAPGGILVYSTCSLEKEENEDVLSSAGVQADEIMRRIPGRDAGDGFFAAVIRG